MLIDLACLQLAGSFPASLISHQEQSEQSHNRVNRVNRTDSSNDISDLRTSKTEMQLTKFAEERNFLAITSSQLERSLEVWDLNEL